LLKASEADCSIGSAADSLAFALHQVMLRWLILLGVIAVGLCVLWDQGLIMKVLDSDRSRISLVIMAVFVATTAHASYRAWQISHEDNVLTRLLNDDAAHLFPGDSAVAVYLRFRTQNSGSQPGAAGERPAAAEVLSARLNGGQELGWLIADLMFKLGLLGTVVGFVFMLGSVVDIESLDIKTMQNVLLQMSDGMRVALYTTMTGLAGGMLLGIQYHFLDRAADGVLIRVKECGELGVETMRQSAVISEP